MKILFFFIFILNDLKGSQHAIAACVNTYLWDFCFFSASHFIHNSKTLEGGGKRVAWCKGQAVVVGRKNCRLRHILKSLSPEDGRWTLFHPLGSNGVVVNHVRSNSPCFYSRDETSGATRGLFLFHKTLLMCISFFVLCFFQMRYHLRYYATEISWWAHNFLSSAIFFFFNGNPCFVISNQSLPVFFTGLTICHKFEFHWVSAGVLNQKSGYKEFSART